MADPIQFGTSGWRGLIARDFTFDRVRLATQGIADYLKNSERRSFIQILSKCWLHGYGREQQTS